MPFESDYPFRKVTEGHLVTGITFEKPIPWMEFDGAHSAKPIAERLADALNAANGESKADRLRAAFEEFVVAFDEEAGFDQILSALREATESLRDVVAGAKPVNTSGDEVTLPSLDGVTAAARGLADALKWLDDAAKRLDLAARDAQTVLDAEEE